MPSGGDSSLSRVALVTGGSRGIGKAVSLALMKQNYRVAILSKSERCVSVAKELSDLVGRRESAVGIRCDVENLQSIPDAVKTAQERLGQIDVLINNAGIAIDGLVIRMSTEDMQKVLTTNLTAPIVFSREVSKSWIRRQVTGNIIMIGSIVGEYGNAGQVAYAASKAGLVGATKSLAQELGKKGIRTNLIAPGFVKTDMTVELAKRYDATPNKPNFIEPEEVATTVLHVLHSPNMNGQVITIDSLRPILSPTG
jgi:3-oxoacyl-[acyl-carrier protein] reductase